MGGNELTDAFFVFFALVCLQVGDQTFTAHVLYNLLRRVECSLILVVLQQIFKYTPKHFRVNTYLRIIWVVLINRKVIL